MPPSSNDMWLADGEVVAEVQRLIANFHPNLALVDKEIAVVFKAKAGKRGGVPLLGKVSRAGKLISVLTKQDYKYVLEIAADEWKMLGLAQQTALLDHLLCQCKVEEDEKSGEIKCSIAPPQVQMFWAEVKRHGVWMNMPEGLENDPAPLKIEDAAARAEPADPPAK